jgi:transcriptional regulator with XRE-family HTH domain
MMPEDTKGPIDSGSSWEEQVEDSIGSINIGDRIRRLRLKRSMGLIELGRLTGLSASFLSQLETGRCVPTLRNLSRIALVFGRDLSYFFASEHSNVFRISRGHARTRLTVKDKRIGPMISESMSKLIPDKTIVPCIAEFEMRESDASFFPDIFEGEEFVYVLSGSVAFRSAEKEILLEPQDVLWTDGRTAREYQCKAGRTARAMIVTCPQRRLERTMRGAYARF